MKKLVYLFVFYFLLTFSVYAQKKYELDPAIDLYSVEAVFKHKLLTSKCDCCCSIYRKSKKCSLYEVEIKKVILHRDSAVYKGKEELNSVKYMVLPDEIEQEIVFNSLYTIFAYNSCLEKVLIINQLLIETPNPIPTYSGLAHVTGVTKCKDFTLFQRIFLFLGINREKIYEKAKDLPPERSKFVQAIESRD